MGTGRVRPCPGRPIRDLAQGTRAAWTAPGYSHARGMKKREAARKSISPAPRDACAREEPPPATRRPSSPPKATFKQVQQLSPSPVCGSPPTSGRTRSFAQGQRRVRRLSLGLAASSLCGGSPPPQARSCHEFTYGTEERGEMLFRSPAACQSRPCLRWPQSGLEN